MNNSKPNNVIDHKNIIVRTIEMMTATPAKIMKVYNKAGSLSPGKYADIVFFDDNLDVKLTMIGGKVIFEEE